MDLNKKINGIDLSPNEIEKLYKNFSSQNKKAMLYKNYHDDIPYFVNYLISNKIIENDESSIKSLTKEGYRIPFRAAATTLKNFGLFYTGYFLENSLIDTPKTKSYAESSNLSADIKLQAGYKDLKNEIKTEISKLPSSQNSYTRVDCFKLNKNGTNKKSWDMFLSLHGVSYSVKATKNTSTKKWSYIMTVTDYYDFKKENYESTPIISTINNYAYGAQQAGAIVPFNIKVIINDSI